MPYSFKNCYLKSMGVNYAPQGTPSFFKGGKHPTEAEISLEFGEVEPVTRQDAEKGDFTMEAGTNSTIKVESPSLLQIRLLNLNQFFLRIEDVEGV